MKIIKIICDKCGKEIKGFDEYSGLFGKLIGRGHEPDIELNLCPECSIKLRKFLGA